MDNITIKYDAVLSICDEITKVIRDLNEQIEQVNRILITIIFGKEWPQISFLQKLEKNMIMFRK